MILFCFPQTFILVGSTKLIQIIAFYGDLIVGGPCRLLGGFFFDRARGEPVTLDVSFFGFFKTRLVGPPIEEGRGKTMSGDDDRGLIDFDNVKPTDVPLLAVSGGVKVVGETSKVSAFDVVSRNSVGGCGDEHDHATDSNLSHCLLYFVIALSRIYRDAGSLCWKIPGTHRIGIYNTEVCPL